jgi:hypothetical protein
MLVLSSCHANLAKHVVKYHQLSPGMHTLSMALDAKAIAAPFLPKTVEMITL